MATNVSGATSSVPQYQADAQSIFEQNVEMNNFTQMLNVQQTMVNNINSMHQGQNTQSQTNSEAMIKQANKGPEMLKAAMGNS